MLLKRRRSLEMFGYTEIYFFNFEKVGKIIMYILQNGIIRQNISNSIKVVTCIFAPAFTLPQILTVKMLDLKNRPSSRSTIFRHDPIRLQMAKSTKQSHTFFFTGSHCFGDITLLHLLTFRKYIKVTDYISFHKDASRRQMWKYIKYFHTFLRQLLPFQIY